MVRDEENYEQAGNGNGTGSDTGGNSGHARSDIQGADYDLREQYLRGTQLGEVLAEAADANN